MMAFFSNLILGSPFSEAKEKEQLIILE